MINYYIYQKLKEFDERVLKKIWITTSILSALFFSYIMAKFIGLLIKMMSISHKQVTGAPTITNYFQYSLYTFGLFVIFMILFTALFLFLYYQYYENLEYNFGEIREGHNGTARWTTKEEIKEQYKAIPLYENGLNYYRGQSGTLVSRINDMLYIDTTDSHNLIIGRTRSGKTQTKVLTDIENYSRSEEKPHLILSSGKYEVLQQTQKMLQDRGYECHVLNLIDMMKSFGYNPLTLIGEAYLKGDYDEAIELCKTFSYPLYHNENSKDPVWEETAMALVNALILALCHEFIGEGDNTKEEGIKYVNMYNVANMLNILSEVDDSNTYLLDKYFDSLSINSPARMEYSTIRMSAGQTRASIFTSAQAKIRQFTAQRVGKLMATTTFNFNKFVEVDKDTGDVKPIAVYLVLPDYVETNYIIATTWIQQMYYSLSQYASKNEDRLPKRIRLVLDEFGNLPSFSEIGSMLSVGAGRGFLFDFYIQDDSQLEKNYGKDTARLIKSQAMNRFFLLSGDPTTREEFSKVLGNKEVVQRTRNGGFFSTSKQVTETPQSRPLLTADELGRLKEGEVVIERSTKRKDLKGNLIQPYPILNTEESRFLYAYEYLGDLIRKRPISELDLPVISDTSLHKDTEQFANQLNKIKKQLAKKEHREKQIRNPMINEESTNELDNIYEDKMGKGKVTIVDGLDTSSKINELTEDDKEDIVTFLSKDHLSKLKKFKKEVTIEDLKKLLSENDNELWGEFDAYSHNSK
ncbi:type IV secretion system protein VirD4 [Granulicatella balaenopterae]|uniref:Type IV secretion system protein VirD4 n=1 Tax=Granulicatella balaenopterae TaxID=137733 RepID=A0A1H9HZP0_9LACT|nr:type IV secretory system conjugative DNA transfer family protein [Granulicatella balaenopterae]SEQ67836.1 type IV secretion system protein VirD4 [Granulicatella balaenopterae]